MQFSENEHLPKEDKRGGEGGTLLHYWWFFPSTFSSKLCRPEIKIFLRALWPQKHWFKNESHFPLVSITR